jgi:hypothetical protein
MRGGERRSDAETTVCVPPNRFRSLGEARCPPRRALHTRIAKTLDENFAEMRDTQPEILAYHYAQAGKPALAIEWWSKACEREMLRSAYNEAIVDFERASGSRCQAVAPDRKTQKMPLRSP